MAEAGLRCGLKGFRTGVPWRARRRAHARRQSFGDGKGRRHRMEEGRAFRRNHDRGASPRHERRDDAVGDRHHVEPHGDGVVHKLYRRARVGLHADGEEGVPLSRLAQGVRSGSARTIEQPHRTAGQTIDIGEMTGDRIARAIAEHMDAPGSGERRRDGGHRIERVGPAERRHMPLERLRQVEGEHAVAALAAARDQRLGPAGEFRLAAPQPLRIEGAQAVIALQAHALRQPRHRGRRHAGALRLLAHGKKRHVARVVEHPLRRRAKLARHRPVGFQQA